MAACVPPSPFSTTIFTINAKPIRAHRNLHGHSFHRRSALALQDLQRLDLRDDGRSGAPRPRGVHVRAEASGVDRRRRRGERAALCDCRRRHRSASRSLVRGRRRRAALAEELQRGGDAQRPAVRHGIRDVDVAARNGRTRRRAHLQQAAGDSRSLGKARDRRVRAVRRAHAGHARRRPVCVLSTKNMAT